jgi:hypothetical protein
MAVMLSMDRRIIVRAGMLHRRVLFLGCIIWLFPYPRFCLVFLRSMLNITATNAAMITRTLVLSLTLMFDTGALMSVSPGL